MLKVNFFEDRDGRFLYYVVSKLAQSEESFPIFKEETLDPEEN